MLGYHAQQSFILVFDLQKETTGHTHVMMILQNVKGYLT